MFINKPDQQNAHREEPEQPLKRAQLNLTYGEAAVLIFANTNEMNLARSRFFEAVAEPYLHESVDFAAETLLTSLSGIVQSPVTDSIKIDKTAVAYYLDLMEKLDCDFKNHIPEDFPRECTPEDVLKLLEKLKVAQRFLTD
jgi:hypothetical protein